MKNERTDLAQADEFKGGIPDDESRRQHMLILRKEMWWLAANAVGLAAFLYLASWTWREPELRGESVATGGVAFIWALSALPVLVVFFVADLIWFSRTAARQAESKDWRPMIVVMATAACWIAAAALDQLNH